jgi:hypothetical protein
LSSRLKRLERLVPDLPAEQPEPVLDSRRWLTVLELTAEGAAEVAGREGQDAEGFRQVATAATAGAAVLHQYIRDWLEAGRIGAHMEYHCGCALTICAAWWHAEEDDSWHGQPFPFLDEATRLQEALQIDHWRSVAIK